MTDRVATPTLSIVLPVYNEGANIEPVLRGLETHLEGDSVEILVVYDFDSDDTVPVVKRLRSEMANLRLQRNDLGPGVLNAIRAGFQAARAPHVLVMMADGSDEPQIIRAMLAEAAAGADVVAGSRYMKGGSQVGGPLLKRTLSRVAGLTLHWIGGMPIHDPTSNFKLYSRRLLDRVEIESSAGFELAIELTVKAYLLGMPVHEVPTTWRDRTAGSSRFQLWKWLPRYLHWYLKGLSGRLRKR